MSHISPSVPSQERYREPYIAERAEPVADQRADNGGKPAQEGDDDGFQSARTSGDERYGYRHSFGYVVEPYDYRKRYCRPARRDTAVRDSRAYDHSFGKIVQSYGESHHYSRREELFFIYDGFVGVMGVVVAVYELVEVVRRFRVIFVYMTNFLIGSVVDEYIEKINDKKSRERAADDDEYICGFGF